ncbi:unnamed protein product [Vicia faba]|uniref:Uncharacterized protein n=1 Tax=Vicia faba TaxID=3906 RepID=A0AAV1B799_VICFA|nr:unnamed protein product [Vicia faba]
MDKRAVDNLNKHGEGTSKKPRIDADVGEPFPIIIKKPLDEGLADLTKCFKSTDFVTRFKAVSKLKRLFSNGHIFHYTEALQNGVVPYLVKFITRDDLGVQLLSASLIADMTLFPKAVDVLIDNGAVEQLSVLLNSSKDSVMQEEIIRSLGNMASVSQESYNKVTKTALCLLVHIYAKSESTPVSVLNMLEWTLSIIKRGFGADEIEIDDLSSILSSIKEMLSKENETYILFACDSLSIITCLSIIDVSLKAQTSIKMLNAILLAGETEGHEHPSSHLNPFSKNVKDFVRTDLRGLGNVTNNNAYYKVIEILEKN